MCLPRKADPRTSWAALCVAASRSGITAASLAGSVVTAHGTEINDGPIGRHLGRAAIGADPFATRKDGCSLEEGSLVAFGDGG